MSATGKQSSLSTLPVGDLASVTINDTGDQFFAGVADTSKNDGMGIKDAENSATKKFKITKSDHYGLKEHDPFSFLQDDSGRASEIFYFTFKYTHCNLSSSVLKTI